MKLRCYICGLPLPEKFVVFSLSEETDRVFVSHVECIKRAMDNPNFKIVEVTK